jgi:hypothetical protein
MNQNYLIDNQCFSEYDQCPGRYCGRLVLNESICLLSECQVRIKDLFNNK